MSPCSECGIDMNNAYFRILKIIQPHSFNKEAFEIKQKIIMSYEVLHRMKEHKIYNKIHYATNECYGESEITNSKKNPRDQLSPQELQNKIKKFTIEELEIELTNMIE